MCQTVTISNKVNRLGRRSYGHRMDVAAKTGYSASQLARLNRELDGLYELIYEDWNTVTEEDYSAFGPQLVILIQTLKQLYSECRKAGDASLRNEVKKLDELVDYKRGVYKGAREEVKAGLLQDFV